MTASPATVHDGSSGARTEDTGLDVVTGAFSYSGRAITEELHARGRRVQTLTGHPERSPDRNGVDARPLDFEDLPGLVAAMEGATTLYNTYWVRFPHRGLTHEVAAENSRTLFHAARQAGISRVVHISITHPSLESPYSYFRGKAQVERHLAATGISYAILRPAILFGGDGVLINNIAWLVSHLPIFAVGGQAAYRIRPIHVQDLARLAVEYGSSRQDTIVDAVGPERPTFLELVKLIRDVTGSRTRIVRLPEPLLPPLAALLNIALHDVLLTTDEYRAMANGLADTAGPTTGNTSLSTWLQENGEAIGTRYANELDRHYRP